MRTKLVAERQTLNQPCGMTRRQVIACSRINVRYARRVGTDVSVRRLQSRNTIADWSALLRGSSNE